MAASKEAMMVATKVAKRAWETVVSMAETMASEMVVQMASKRAARKDVT